MEKEIKAKVLKLNLTSDYAGFKVKVISFKEGERTWKSGRIVRFSIMHTVNPIVAWEQLVQVFEDDEVTLRITDNGDIVGIALPSNIEKTSERISC